MSRRSVSSGRAQRGFTLVEMAVVLVIIGLILGAVAIGKDVVRNAEYQKVGQKFVYEWKRAYDNYYQRTGVPLGDSQVSPTGMVNGLETAIGGQPASSGNVDGALAGIPANYSNTGLKICHGQGYAANEVGPGDRALATQDLRGLMQRIGERMPPGRGEGKEDRYLYSDSNGNPAELQICFQWNPDGLVEGAGNVMVIRGLTPDLARFLDQMIDGKPDAIEGRFRLQNESANSSTTNNTPGVEWDANNTYKQGGGATTATGTGADRDEDRVTLMTGHWIMDQ